MDSTSNKLMVKNEKVLQSDKDKDSERETWDRKLDFMLSCIGYAVGLGNIWRFPYLCYKNGGGAFLVPYFIFLVLCGVPLFFLELSFGQFGALGPLAIWKIAPIFKGVGYSMILISFVVCVYYNVIIAYSLHFIFRSFTSVLPWSTCNNTWNTAFCRVSAINDSDMKTTQLPGLKCGKGEGWFEDTGFTTYNSSTLNAVLYMGKGNWTEELTTNGSCNKFTTAAQEYFSHKVLHLSSSIDEVGGIQWELFGCLLLAWVVVFICLFKGVKWSGKIVYFTATFPYFVLIALLIRGVMEEGASEGIYYYFTPNVTKLQDVRVWSDAAVQIFYSLGAAWGVLLSYSSLNKFHNNVYRDALSICCVNCCTSILAGFVVFSVLGALAHQTGRSIEDVVDQGAGLAFVAYPAAVASLPAAPVWAFLFFFMLFNLGLDSQFGMIEAVLNGLTDEYAWLRKNRIKFLAGICVVQFIAGIPMITGSGMYWLTLIDWYASGLPLMFAAALEITCISWNYGIRRFIYDIKCMIGYKPFLWQWWQFAWVFVTPICILLLIVCYFAFYSPVTYDEQKYPVWAEVLGWLTALLSILAIPVVAIFQIVKHPRAEGTLVERVKALLECDSDWGPRDVDINYRYRRSILMKSNKISGDRSPDDRSQNCCQGKRLSASSSSEDLELPPVYRLA